MWLFVVAAGSGYLARCLQKASSTKKPRLAELVASREEEHASRSPPQEDAESYPLSKEAMQFKHRFEKLEDEHVEKQEVKGVKKRLSCEDDDSDNLVPLLSYQKGCCDPRPSRKLKGKAKGWSAWKQVKGCPTGRRKAFEEESPVKSSVEGREAESFLEKEILEAEFERTINEFQEKHLVAEESRARSSCGSQEVYTEATTPCFGFSDASWRNSVDFECSQSVLNISDWTSSKQAMNSRKTKTKHRRHVIRTSSSSTPSTPLLTNTNDCAPRLPPVDMLLQKRKAGNCKLRTAPVISKEVFYFALGLHAGVACMLFSMAQRNQAEKGSLVDSAINGGRKICANDSDSVQGGEVDNDDNESVTSVVTVEHQKPNQMAVLEAELEAELELMELNLITERLPPDRPRSASDLDSSPISRRENSFSNTMESWAVSPRELDRRLHILLAERQEKRIQELEAELAEAESKLSHKEEELKSWKVRVNRLKALYLASAEDIEDGEETSSESIDRLVNRRKWFTTASAPLLPSSLNEREVAADVSIPETPNRYEATEFGLEVLRESEELDGDDLNGRFKEVLERTRRTSSLSSPDGSAVPRRHSQPSESTSRVYVEPASRGKPPLRTDGYIATSEVRQTESRVKQEPPCMNRCSSSEADGGYGRKSEVQRQVSNNFHQSGAFAAFSGRRHSTGSFRRVNATQPRIQRQRRRWFS